MIFRTAFALALALAAPPVVGAPWDGPPFAAEPAAILSAADALVPPRGAAVDVLLDEAVYVFDARGAATFTYRLVYRPYLPEAARRWSRVERSWAPWHQARPEVRARVVGPDGSVHELDPRTLAEQGVGDDGEVFSDRRLLAGPLPGVRPGAVVEEVSIVRDLAPLFDGGVSARFWLAQPNPVRLSRLRIEAPEALPLRWVVRGDDRKPTVRVENGVRTVVFERRDVPAAPRPESGAPRDTTQAPVVLFGWGRSWSDAAERYGALWRRQLEKEPLPEAARAAVRGAGGDEAIRRALAWIHERVRYTGLELGEAEILPATPAETLKRRYGDCKDLSLLLVAMLREAGIEARVALLRTAWIDLAPELPGLGQFDHAIVRVEGKAPTWIDPTDPFSPPGRLPPPDEGRLALVTGPGQTDLVRTPEVLASENAAETVRELRLAELGPGRIVETRTLRGALAAAERAFRARVPSDRREELDRRYARDVFRADLFLGADVKGEADPSAPLHIRVEADRSEAIETADDAAEIPVAPDLVFEPLPRALRGVDEEGAPRQGEPPPRETDLVLPLAYRWDVTYRVVPPEGFRIRLPLPPDRSERFGPASFTQTFTAAPDGTVTATFRFDAGERRLPASAADALGRRVREIVRGRGPTVTFERTAAALLAAGRVREGLAEIRRLAALHPREAMHRLHLAIALLQLGLSEEAAAEARRGIALEPERAWGHRVLGYVLEHDLVGRFHGPGFDRAGALAAYEAAKAKDPTHAGGRAALAELLAHDPSGLRHGPGADLGRALAEYGAVHDELGARDYDEGYLAALFAAGRHADAMKLARTMAPAAERNAILVAAVAVVDGPQAAEEAAGTVAEGRREALRDASVLLVKQRRHALGAALAGAAARGAPNAAELFAQSEIFGALRPWEKLAAEGDDAERLVRRLFVAVLRAADPAKELAALAAPRVLEGEAGRTLEAGLPLPPAAARAALRETTLPADVLLDLLLSRLETVRSGDTEGGLRLRIRVQLPFGAGGQQSTLYVVRSAGALRLVATDAAWPLLGAEAERRGTAGDGLGAGRWLDWAREAVPGSASDLGSPAGILATLWRAGSEDAAAARRAGAALAAFGAPTAGTLSLLRTARAVSRDPAEERALSHALAQALRAQGDAEGTLRAADEILADDAGSRDGFAMKAWALRRLGRIAALGPAAEALLARAPHDTDALGLVGTTWLLAGDLDQAARTFRLAIDDGKAPPPLYNNAAWLELFREPVGPLALDWARRAVDQGREHDDASLNTLAAAYAAFGKPAEAREIFLRSIEGGRPLTSSDWYVFGRIAEAWGIEDAARASYRRTEPRTEDGGDDPTSAHLLARRRLEQLGPSPASSAGPAAKQPAAGEKSAPARR